MGSKWERHEIAEAVIVQSILKLTYNILEGVLKFTYAHLLLPSRIPNAYIMQDHEPLRVWVVSRRVWRVDHIPDNHTLDPQVAISAHKLICLPAAVIRHDETFNHAHDTQLRLRGQKT